MLITSPARRAEGTALDWPEAKKQAHLVRSWGIKVRKMRRHSHTLFPRVLRTKFRNAKLIHLTALIATA